MPVPSPYLWNPGLERFQDTRSGRIVPSSRMRDGVNDLVDGTSQEMRDLAQRLQSGGVTLAEWQAGMRDLIHPLHTSAVAAGMGGFQAMSVKGGQPFAENIINAQLAYLDRFATDIYSGRQPLDGRLLSRVDLYAQAARASHIASQRQEAFERGSTWEASRLMQADHCPGCVGEAARGWVRMGQLVPPGHRQCLSRCHCYLVFKKERPDGRPPRVTSDLRGLPGTRPEERIPYLEALLRNVDRRIAASPPGHVYLLSQRENILARLAAERAALATSQARVGQHHVFSAPHERDRGSYLRTAIDFLKGRAERFPLLRKPINAVVDRLQSALDRHERNRTVTAFTGVEPGNVPSQPKPAPSATRVRITGGAFEGQQGVVLGKTPNGVNWRVQLDDGRVVMVSVKADALRRVAPEPVKPTKPTFGPGGELKPVSAAVNNVFSGNKPGFEMAKRVLDTIDGVHTDGEMPRIPLRVVGIARGNAASGFEIGLHDGAERGLFVSTASAAKTPFFNAIHEVGHFLDYSGISRRLSEQNLSTIPEGANWTRNYASHSNLPIMDAWRQAVQATPTYQRLLEASRASTITRGNLTIPNDPAYAQYMLSEHEIFARAYAQYVTTRSGNQEARRDLAYLQQEAQRETYPWQWQDDEFQAIAQSMDDIFRALGWLHDRRP